VTIPTFEPEVLEAACERSRALMEEDKFDADGFSIYQTETQLLGLTYTHELDAGTIKSVTSFTRQDVLPGKQDNDGTALPVSGMIAGPEFGYDESFRKAVQYSQELQFSGLAFDENLDYTVGVFAQIEDLDEHLYRPGGGRGLLAISGGATGLPFPILLPNDTSFQFGAQDISKRNETYAVFAQGSYALTDLLELTVGGRYTLEKRDLVNDLHTISPESATALLNQGVAAGHLAPLGPVYFAPGATGLVDFYNAFITKGYALDQVTSFSGDEEYKEFTPMVSLKYSLPDAALDALGLDLATTYLTYSSGFKSGGLEAATTGMVRFDPEKVANYELGFKIDALESRLRLNGALFYTDYEDIQIRNAQIFGEGDNVEIIIANAGKAKISGAELELTWQALDSLQVVAAAGWLQADLEEFDEVQQDDPTQVSDRSDEDFQEVPDKTFSLALVHTADFDQGSLSSRVEAYYRDEVYIGIDDLSWDRKEDATLPSYTLVNARVTWESADNRWQLAAWGRNLTDKRTFDGRVSVLGLVGSTQLTPSLPRTYGLQLKLFF
jgi:outer membrane receptor protein involved in Fe transport